MKQPSRWLTFSSLFLALALASGAAALGQTAAQPPSTTPSAAPPQGVTITNYNLALTFNFPLHQLSAVAKVDLTPLQPITSIIFALNPNLKVTQVADAAGQSLATQRTSQGLVVTFPAPLAQGAAQTLTFQYNGLLATAQFSPIPGIRTAYVGPEGAFLLYPGQWFPLLGYATDRFTATISADLPSQYGMVASGVPTAAPQPDGTVLYTYQQSPATFPGSVIITQLRPLTIRTGGLTTNFYFSSDVPQDLTREYANAAGRVYDYLSSRFGPPPTTTLHFVELPNDSLPSFASPNLILLSKSSIGAALNYRLLVDEIAQQWFGMMVSPATLNDAWLQYGAARFAEALYVQEVAGNEAYKNVIQDFTVGALSYPNIALANTATLYAFSPQFQDLTYDKGAMLFHMLRWEMGDQKLLAGMKAFLADYAWKPATTADFEAVLEKTSGLDLRAFFSEWYHGSGVPTFTNQYIIYRLGEPVRPDVGAGAVASLHPAATGAPGASAEGAASSTAIPSFSQRPHYRVTGKLQQPLDLFTMPIQVQIETDGATVLRRVNLSGTSGDYSFLTESRPRKIVIDPNDWILKSTPDLQVRVDIARGDNDVAADDFPNALDQYHAALKVNPISSLAHYRLAEAYFLQQNWQQAANEYRSAIDGDQQPAWVTVWSHIQLGKIFDLTGQRDRAVNEYQLAVQTNDNTQNAQVLARQLLKTPYKQSPSR